MRQKFNDSSHVSACLNFGRAYDSSECHLNQSKVVDKNQHQMYISQYKFDFKNPKIKFRSEVKADYGNNFRCRCQKCSDSLNDYNLQKQTSLIQRNYFSSEAPKNSLINCIKPFKQIKIRQKKHVRKKDSLNRTFVKQPPQVMVENHLNSSSFESVNLYKLKPVMTSSTGSSLNIIKPKKISKKKYPKECNQSIKYDSNLNNNNIDTRNKSNPNASNGHKKNFKNSNNLIDKRKNELKNLYQVNSENVFKRVYLVQPEKEENKVCNHLSFMCEKCVRSVKKENLKLFYLDLFGKKFGKKSNKKQMEIIVKK